MPIKQGPKTFQKFQECVDANKDKDSPGGFCKSLEEKQSKLKSAIGKITLASKEAKVANFIEIPNVDKLRLSLTKKQKAKIASLPGKKRLLLASLDSVSDDGKYASYFLLTGDMINGRGWGVTAPSIPKNIRTFIGMPFTITSSDFIENSPYGKIYDHPTIEHLPLLGLAQAGSFDVNDEKLMIKFQNKFRIGEIIDVFEKDGIWRAIVKIDEKYRKKPLPPFTSPSLLADDETEPEGQITKWHGLHLTGLDQRPAYGSIAMLKGECQGPLGKCAMQLKNGSMGLYLESSKIKNASGPKFVGFSDVRTLADGNSFMFANLHGPGRINGPKPMKPAPCKIAAIVGPLKESKQKLASLVSPDVAETQIVNVHCDEKDSLCKKQTRLKKALDLKT